MTPPNPPDPGRAAARLQWARAATGDAGLALARASTDAGFRSYWRAATTAGSLIVMDSPPALEDVRPWLRIRDLLEDGDVRVPRVLARDVEAGFLLLEDLGTDTYLQVIDAGNADALFDAAIGQLLKLQAIACPAGLPAYDAALLERELRLFDQWYLGRHLGVTLEPDEATALEGAYRFLVSAAMAQPQVLVHRDFMPRNLMPVPASEPRDGPVVLDFQDAVRGPLAYDVLSLFKDAFVSWPQPRIDGWMGDYRARALAAGLPVPASEAFRRDVDLIGVQRHLKVLGIFARLHHRDDKPKYLRDARRFIAYLDEVVPRYPQLDALAGVLARYLVSS